MDYHRNDILLQELKTKLDLNLSVKDDDSRIFLKAYFKTDSEIHQVKFDKDDTTLSLGCSDGFVYVYDLQRSERTSFYSYNTTQSKLKVPVTGMRWLYNDKSAKLKQVLVTSNTDGTITYKNIRTDSTVAQFKEEDNNEIYAIDICKNHLATAGKDAKVRIYDVETQQQQQTLTTMQWVQAGHNNRIFSVKMVPYDKNLLVSGGWDQNVNIWDLRVQKTIGCVLGPKICGDSIDIREGQILTGSNRMSEQLQIWDLGTQKLIQNIKWDPKTDDAGAFIYGAQFSKAKLHAVAGVSHGSNEFKLFDFQKGEYSGNVGFGGFSKGLYAMDFANLSNKIVIGGGDGIAIVVAILQNSSKP